MPARKLQVGVVAGALVGALAAPGVALTVRGQARQDAGLVALLESVGEYLANYAVNVSGVVAVETYTQRLRDSGLQSPGTTTRPMTQVRERRLRAELAFLADDRGGWIEFRDIFEVDGRPVRDRDQRLAKLFISPSPASLEQARRIVAEGARYNLNGYSFVVDRTINLPMAALTFVLRANQARSAFTVESIEALDGRDVVVVRFEETAMPRLIESRDKQAASGRLWIERSTGAVLRTEMALATRGQNGETRATIRVRYGAGLLPGFWLPAEMTEDYEVVGLGTNARVTGEATYSAYRRYSVAVEEDYKIDRRE